jgi:hypothetical protein
MKVASWLTCITILARKVHMALLNIVWPSRLQRPRTPSRESHVQAFANILVIGIPALFIFYDMRSGNSCRLPSRGVQDRG